MTHECPLSRSIGYFLEPVIMLAPFAKKPMQLTIRGITTDDRDLSVSRVDMKNDFHGDEEVTVTSRWILYGQ